MQYRQRQDRRTLADGRWMPYAFSIIRYALKSGGHPMLRSFFAKEEGQGLVEYALILALIAIVVIGVLTLLGKNVNNKISQIGSAIQ
jgi:pilus assembly protein Flp/PilA